MRANTKRATAIAIFNTGLVSLPTIGWRAFRKNVVAGIVNETGVSVNSAKTMYNHAKNLAVAADSTLISVAVVEPVDAEQPEPVVAEPVDAAEPTDGPKDAWAVVDAENKIISTHISRSKARAVKVDGQRVVAIVTF